MIMSLAVLLPFLINLGQTQVELAIKLFHQDITTILPQDFFILLSVQMGNLSTQLIFSAIIVIMHAKLAFLKVTVQVVISVVSDSLTMKHNSVIQLLDTMKVVSQRHYLAQLGVFLASTILCALNAITRLTES